MKPSTVVRSVALRVGISAMAAALLTGAAIRGVDSSTSPRNVALEVTTAAAIVQSPTSVGIADSSLYFASDEDIARTLDELQQLGVQNVRIQIPWAGVEVARDTYFWQRIDKQVEAAAARNMGILGVINQTPGWMADGFASHPDPTEFGQFAADVAARYKGRVSAYEIWNEPNYIQFFDPIDPAAYTQLLKAAYQPIKDVDPTIIVVGGVLGSVLGQGRVLLNPVDFVDQMLQAGAAGYFDALSFHPYQYTLKFSEGATQIQSPLRQLEAIRRLLEAAGIGTLPVWATEYGLPTTVVTPQQQADFIDDFLHSWQQVAYAGPLFIYTTRDFAEGSTNDEDNFGIFYADWSQKPAAQVIADFIESLQPQHPVRDAIVAAVRALAQLAGQVVDFVFDAVKFVAQAFVNVVVGVIEAGVGLARAAADAISGLVHAITDCLTGSAVRADAALVDDTESVMAASAYVASESRLSPPSVLPSQASDHGVAPSATDVPEPSGDVEADVADDGQPDAVDVDSDVSDSASEASGRLNEAPSDDVAAPTSDGDSPDSAGAESDDGIEAADPESIADVGTEKDRGVTDDAEPPAARDTAEASSPRPASSATHSTDDEDRTAGSEQGAEAGASTAD